MFYQILLSPQVKWSTSISNKHSIYKVSNELRIRMLGKIIKSENLLELSTSAQSSCSLFFQYYQKLLKNRTWTFPVRRYVTLGHVRGSKATWSFDQVNSVILRDNFKNFYLHFYKTYRF